VRFFYLTRPIPAATTTATLSTLSFLVKIDVVSAAVVVAPGIGRV